MAATAIIANQKHDEASLVKEFERKGAVMASGGLSETEIRTTNFNLSCGRTFFDSDNAGA